MTSNTLSNLTPKSAAIIRVSENTKARFVANLENGSDEWHQLRATGIGGSEVGTICGLNKWESAYRLWAVKTGQLEDTFTGNEATEWGNRLEPVILDKFADEHPEMIVHENVGTWAHPDRDWQLANPDAIFEEWVGEDPDLDEDQKVTRFGIIEVKTAQFEDDWNPIPPQYRAQVQWYLQTFGFSRAIVIVLFHGNRYREVEILADEFEQAAQLERAIEFRHAVETGTQPDWDGSLSTYTTVRELNPDIEDGEVELGELGIAYLNANNALKNADETVTAIKSQILDKMGTAKRGLVDGVWAFTRQSKAGGTPYLVQKRG